MAASEVVARITLVEGEQQRTVEVPLGHSSVGRAPDCAIQVNAGGVSRHHCVIQWDGDSLLLEDVGSTNGTWVNGNRVSGSRQIFHGDRVSLGDASLRLDLVPRVSEHAVAATNAPAPKKKVRLGRTLLIAAISGVVLLACNVAVTFLTDWTGVAPWIAAPVVAVVAALIDVAKQPFVGDPTVVTPETRSSAPRGRTSVAAALLVVLVVVGGGGWAATAAVKYVTGQLTGNEEGDERLLRQVKVNADGLTFTVHSVQQTPHFVRVRLSVRSTLSNSVTLRLFENCSLTPQGGQTLKADPFRSEWVDAVPAGGGVDGVINFPGELPSSAISVNLSFATVFAQGFDGPRSVNITKIRLNPLPS